MDHAKRRKKNQRKWRSIERERESENCEMYRWHLRNVGHEPTDIFIQHIFIYIYGTYSQKHTPVWRICNESVSLRRVRAIIISFLHISENPHFWRRRRKKKYMFWMRIIKATEIIKSMQGLFSENLKILLPVRYRMYEWVREKERERKTFLLYMRSECLSEIS